MSDRTGEDELYIAPQDGMSPETRITFDGRMFRLPPVWAPDSKKLLFADKDVRLWYVDIQTKKPVLIDQGNYDDLQGYSWSPDSQWVAYGKTSENHNSVIYLYSLADGKITPATTDFYSSWNPVFDPQGRYLYFLSARSYNETTGVYDFGFSNPMAVARLRGHPPGRPAFALRCRRPTGKRPAQANAAPAGFGIDLAGIADRVAGLPRLSRESHRTARFQGRDLLRRGAGAGALRSAAGPNPGDPRLRSERTQGRHPGERRGPLRFILRRQKDLVRDAQGSPTGEERRGVRPGGTHLRHRGRRICPKSRTRRAMAPEPGRPCRPTWIPRAEWRQIFNEVWRQERDYFFEPAMNGVNWEAQREKYAPLVAHAASRYDLTYIIGEMIGELSNSHTYVGGGDYPDLKPVNAGLLGIDFRADPAHGLYRIEKIYPGQNWRDGSALAAHRAGHQRQSRRLSAGGERPPHPHAAKPVRVVRQRRQSGSDPDRELAARRTGRARHRGETDRQRIQHAGIGLDRDEPEQGGRHDRRARRLHLPAGYVGGRSEPVRRAVLPADPQGGA